MLLKYRCGTKQGCSMKKNIREMPRLTQAERNRAIGMADMGASQRQIARTFSNLLSRYQQAGQAQDHPRSGWPRVITPAENRYIRTIHLRNRFVTATALGHPISRWTRTVLRRLAGLVSEISAPSREMALTLLHRQCRLQWARTVRRWQWRDWERVLFTDESRFNMFRNDGRVHVYRGCVMVWGGICGRRTTRLIIIRGDLTGQRYRDEVLRSVVVPFYASTA